jgi:formylglycine-generating enzyme required for sulfatase activity
MSFRLGNVLSFVFRKRLNKRGYREIIVAEHTFVEIPEGTFQMGSNYGEYKELPIHDVHLDRYWIAKYPVTVTQFERFVESTGYVTDNERGEGCWIEADGIIRYDLDWRHPNFDQGPNHPVICVSWNDAMAYADWFSRNNNVIASLPTEAQWEKAARGTDQRKWPWGDDPPDGARANFADSNYLRVFGPDQRNADGTIDDGYPQTSPVDTYNNGQSPYGVIDMAGNTIDWLYDWYDASYYARSPNANPIGPERNPVRRKFEIPGGWGDNLQRSIRGGSWTDASGVLSVEEGGHSVRSDMRERTDQYSSDDHLGFRLVIDDSDRHPRYAPAVKPATLDTTTRAAVMESIGRADIRIEYDRLAVNGRENSIFGASVPFGKIWSPGDNIATQFRTTENLKIQELDLPAGTYILHMIPEDISSGNGEWTIIFSDVNKGNSSQLAADANALRVRTRAQVEDNSKEHMEYFFDVRDDGTRILRFLYEFVEVHIPMQSSGEMPGEVAEAAVLNAIGNTEIEVSYFRDVAAGGPVFGEVIPFGEVWRGSSGDQSAVIDLSDDVSVNGQFLPAGSYELSFVPREGQPWIFRILRRSSEPSRTQDTSVVLEQSLNVQMTDSGPERLEYYFDYVGENERQLVIAWGGATIPISLTVITQTQA